MFTIKHITLLFCLSVFSLCLVACGSDFDGGELDDSGLDGSENISLEDSKNSGGTDQEENPIDVCVIDSFSCKGNMLMVCSEDHEFVPYLMCPQGMCNSDKGNCKPDQYSQGIFEQTEGLCESVACAEYKTTRPLCVYVAEALSSYLEENRLALEDAFKTYEGFDWSDTTYDLVSAYNLYRVLVIVESCDTEGVAENADQSLNAFNALSSIEGFNAAMTDAANKCAKGECVLD